MLLFVCARLSVHAFLCVCATVGLAGPVSGMGGPAPGQMMPQMGGRGAPPPGMPPGMMPPSLGGGLGGGMFGDAPEDTMSKEERIALAKKRRAERKARKKNRKKRR